MAVDGNWNITMSTPMGERNATLTLKNAGGKLTGTQGAEGQSTEIFEGTANGDDVAWKVCDHQPDAADAGLHRQGFRRQHFRRNGHRPDGQLPVQGHKGVSADGCRPRLVRNCARERGPIRRGCSRLRRRPTAFPQQ